jgi:hypothetical protein
MVLVGAWVRAFQVSINPAGDPRFPTRQHFAYGFMAVTLFV